jgi:hypothetical protein
MTSYINQTIAKQQIAELIAHAEQARLGREIRQARRASRAAARSASGPGAGGSGTRVRWSQRLGLATAR